MLDFKDLAEDNTTSEDTEGIVKTFKDLSEDNVKKVDKSKLIEVLHDSIEKMMEVQFVEVPKHEAARHIYIPSYDDIKKDIKYKYEDVKGIKIFKMSVPIIDETKRVKFSAPVFSQNKPDKMHPRGYFILMEAEIKLMPLGLIEVYFRGFKRRRMSKDYKNLEPIREYTRTEYLYFDYEAKKFRQPITKEMEDVKIGLKREKILDELLRDKETAEDIRVYLEREKIKDNALTRLVEYSEELQDEILEFINDKYDVKWKDDQMIINNGVIVRTELTSNNLKQYLIRYQNYLKMMPHWLKINLIFSNITVKEFDILSKYNKELADETIPLILNDMVKLDNLLMKNNPGRKENKEITIQNVDWKEKKYLFSDEEKLAKSIQSKLDNELEKPKEIRPKDFNKQLPLQGFIYKKETGELCPTFAEMENRRYLKEWYGSYLEDRKYIEEVLKTQKKN